MSEPIRNTEQLPIAWIKKEYSPDCGYFFNIYEHEIDGYMPVYTHPIRDDEDDDIFRKEQVEKFYAEARPLREKYKLRELTDEEIIDAWKMFPNWGHEQHILMFGRELLKKANTK